jgi:hypothetical protein
MLHALFAAFIEIRHRSWLRMRERKADICSIDLLGELIAPIQSLICVNPS